MNIGTDNKYVKQQWTLDGDGILHVVKKGKDNGKPLGIVLSMNSHKNHPCAGSNLASGKSWCFKLGVEGAKFFYLQRFHFVEHIWATEATLEVGQIMADDNASAAAIKGAIWIVRGSFYGLELEGSESFFVNHASESL